MFFQTSLNRYITKLYWKHFPHIYNAVLWFDCGANLFSFFLSYILSAKSITTILDRNILVNVAGWHCRRNTAFAFHTVQSKHLQIAIVRCWNLAFLLYSTCSYWQCLHLLVHLILPRGTVAAVLNFTRFISTLTVSVTEWGILASW